MTYPPAARQHPSSPAIRAFWGAAERRTARDTWRGSPFEMLTSPWRQSQGDHEQFHRDKIQQKQAFPCRLASIGSSFSLVGGPEVNLVAVLTIDHLVSLKDFKWLNERTPELVKQYGQLFNYIFEISS